MNYRLALDLGSTSLGWAILRLHYNEETNAWEPCAIIKAGVRIFSDGRNPKDGSSLAVTRRIARGMRRRRDRLLKRKARMASLLVEYGFFPQDMAQRKALETLNPYELRAKGLDAALTPAEFARALFHINQRRGFKSNRKTDTKENDSGAMKVAISGIRQEMADRQCRTVGELLRKRQLQGEHLRARYRTHSVLQDNGKNKIEKSYDLYIDRAMIEQEFDALWAKQAKLNPQQYHKQAQAALKNCLLFQRPLKPVQPGRCTLLPDEERAPLALPSTQRFRMYQEVNNLRILGENLQDKALSLEQRNAIINALEKKQKQTFKEIIKLLKLPGTTQFNLEDIKRQDLNGNKTSALLSKDDFFGKAWLDFDEAKQDDIVLHMVNDESEAALVQWLQTHTGVDEAHAEKIANARLPEGYGSLSAKALKRILPELRQNVITYDKAVQAAGFSYHAKADNIEIFGRTFEYHKTDLKTGEIQILHIFKELPYYGEFLQRHVGFADPKATANHPPEKRFGRIANPTVHIGLNQVRTVVNALIKRYGHPSEVIIEVARELKQSRDQKREEQQKQAANQKRNDTYRQEIAKVMRISEHEVKHADIQKMILWVELNPYDAMDRRCPYSGEQISLHTLFTDAVEIEHILPFSQTLDDTLNNKTVAMRNANRVKSNRTPWEAKAAFEAQGWDYECILQRAAFMAKNKRYRFAQDGYQQWLREDKTFLARALNDTRYLSRVSREYLCLICPQNTRVIPGQMTALLRAKFGLNHVLGLSGEKNRNDHRHHAVDACVIGVTDQAMLQRFAQASAQTYQKGLDRLVNNMPQPWATYYEHVQRAIANIKVSHKPDHGYESGMHNDTAYGLLGNGMVYVHKQDDNNHRIYTEEKLKVIEMSTPQAMALRGSKLVPRHGSLPDGTPRPYKGYKGDSNYCIEITCNDKGKWESRVISTFEAYQFVRQHGNEGLARLLNPRVSMDNKPLVMRLIRNDCVRLEVAGQMQIMRVVKMKSNGEITLAPLHEANVDARNRDKQDVFTYMYKTAGSLQKAHARQITISPVGELSKKGFKP